MSRESLWPRFLKSFSLGLGLFFLLAFPSKALDPQTVKQIKELKKAGISDEAIIEILKLEKGDKDPTAAVGVKEVPREDGKRDIIYYSVSTPEERKARKREEQFEYEKKWETPPVIIDRRR